MSGQTARNWSSKLFSWGVFAQTFFKETLSNTQSRKVRRKFLVNSQTRLIWHLCLLRPLVCWVRCCQCNHCRAPFYLIVFQYWHFCAHFPKQLSSWVLPHPYAYQACLQEPSGWLSTQDLGVCVLLSTLTSQEQHGECSNSRKPLYFPLMSCHGKWSNMDNGGASSCQTGEQRTCIVPGMRTCAITCGRPGSLFVSRNHFPACPHDSPKVVYYCSCTACGESPALTRHPLSPKSYP